jgi:hypothetical protein
MPLAYFFNHGSKDSVNSFDLPPLASHTALVKNEIGTGSSGYFDNRND